MLGVTGVSDDPCLNPFKPSGEVIVVIQSRAERSESNATSLPRRRVRPHEAIAVTHDGVVGVDQILRQEILIEDRPDPAAQVMYRP